MAPPKATKTAAEKKPAKKTTKTVAGDKKKKVKRSKARSAPCHLQYFIIGVVGCSLLCVCCASTAHFEISRNCAPLPSTACAALLPPLVAAD